MSDIELPDLPPPHRHGGTYESAPFTFYTAEQMRAYAIADREKRAQAAQPEQEDALNTLCKMLHSSEEVEGDDGLAMLVPMDLWNEAQEAIELLVGEDDDTEPSTPVQAEAPTASNANLRRGYMGSTPDGGFDDHDEPQPDPMNYQGMFLDAVRALAEIDTLLGLPEDGCNDPQMTVSALKDYIAGVKEIVGYRDKWVDAQYAEAEREITDAMIDAYLTANDAYWREVDALPRDITKPWRQGTPKEATRVSLRAALATQQEA